MTDFLINECGDLDYTEGKLTVVTGVDAIRQRWLIYIRTFLGEWFLDQLIGVPYFQQILEKGISRQIIKQVFTAASLEVPGVIQVVGVVVDSLDVATRFAEVTVTAIVSTEEGPETGVFRFTGTIPPDNCGIATEAPLTVAVGLEWYWFDPSDLEFVRGNPGPYVPGDPVVLENKFELVEGSALGSGVTNPQITASINGRKALVMEGIAAFLLTGFGAGYPDNIRALRASTGYPDGAVFTIFGVYKPASSPGAGFDPLYTFNGSDPAGTTQRWVNVSIGEVTGELILRFSSETDGGTLFEIDTTPAVGVSPTDTWTFAQRYSQSKSGINAQFWVNGVQVLNSTVSGNVCHTDGQACWNGTLSSSGALTESGLHAIGELIGYRGLLSDENIASIFAYLLPKWGI